MSTSATLPSASGSQGRGGYPLSALFVLITVAAILAGMLSPLARSEIDTTGLLASAGITGLVGTVLGALIGAWIRPVWACAPIGMVTGAIVGGLIGPLTQIPVAQFATLLAACAGGAMTVLLMGVVMRLAGRPRELPVVPTLADAEEIEIADR
jgi:hypothetical protein